MSKNGKRLVVTSSFVCLFAIIVSHYKLALASGFIALMTLLMGIEAQL